MLTNAICSACIGHSAVEGDSVNCRTGLTTCLNGVREPSMQSIWFFAKDYKHWPLPKLSWKQGAPVWPTGEQGQVLQTSPFKPNYAKWKCSLTDPNSRASADQSPRTTSWPSCPRGHTVKAWPCPTPAVAATMMPTKVSPTSAMQRAAIFQAWCS